MLKILISVKDTVAEIFNDPRAEINTASAIRSFSMSVSKSPHKDRDWETNIFNIIDSS